jgi:hypothetical protein
VIRLNQRRTGRVQSLTSWTTTGRGSACHTRRAWAAAHWCALKVEVPWDAHRCARVEPAKEPLNGGASTHWWARAPARGATVVPTLSILLVNGFNRSVWRGWIGERRKKSECARVQWKQITGFVRAEKSCDRRIQMSSYRWSGLNRPRWESKIPAQAHDAAYTRCVLLREKRPWTDSISRLVFELWIVKFRIFLFRYCLNLNWFFD